MSNILSLTLWCNILVLSFLISSVATVLKFRGQIYGSLGAPSFLKFRNAVDTVSSTERTAHDQTKGLLILFILF